MKTKLKYITIHFVCAILLIGTTISCSNDDGITQSTRCNGTPKLVRVTSSTDFETELSSCNLGDWIVLHGQDLCAIDNIIVNGVPVNMREVFLEGNKATLQVPRQLPESNPTNSIEVINGQTSSKLAMQISIPNLYVTGLKNEYALIKDTVKLMGANFDLYNITDEKGEVYFGNKKAKIVETTESYVSVIVPEGAVQGDKIKVVGESAEIDSPGRYKDNRGLFEGFEGGFGWAGTDNMVTDGTKPGDIKPCAGKYLHIIKNVEEGWFPFIANVYTWPEDAFKNPKNWCLKFEIATITSLTKKIMQFDQTQYKWQPWSTTEFTTNGKWETITFEMTDVLNGTTAGDYSGYAFLFQVAFVGDTPEFMNLCIDNFRIATKY